ncbi:MAG: 4-hydroxy-tetrahydrodipicolinate reductase, partial [Pseudomonadales bacterium]
MLRIAVTGAAGRMGKTLIEAASLTDGLELTAAIERPDSTFIGFDAGELAALGKNGVLLVDNVEDVVQQFDVLIDFTAPQATLRNAAICSQAGKKMVVGTTGLDADQKQQLADAAALSAIMFAPNMSVGVNLCFSLLSTAAKV